VILQGVLSQLFCITQLAQVLVIVHVVTGGVTLLVMLPVLPVLAIVEVVTFFTLLMMLTAVPVLVIVQVVKPLHMLLMLQTLIALHVEVIVQVAWFMHVLLILHVVQVLSQVLANVHVSVPQMLLKLQFPFTYIMKQNNIMDKYFIIN